MKRTRFWNRIAALTVSAGLACMLSMSAPVSALTAYAQTQNAEGAEAGETAVDSSGLQGESAESGDAESEAAVDSSGSEGESAESGSATSEAAGDSSGLQGESAESGSTTSEAAGNSSGSEGESVESGDAESETVGGEGDSEVLQGDDAEAQYRKGRAIIVYLTESDLGETPQKDAQAMKATLAQTNEFEESDITLVGVPYNNQTEYKPQIWEAVHAAAEETDADSLTFFIYIGHGNRTRDGSAYLALEGANNIGAEELKTQLSALNGKVVVMLSSCYSGGILTGGTAGSVSLYAEAEDSDEADLGAESEGTEKEAADSGETDAEECTPQEVQEQAQDASDAFGESFLAAFFGESNEAAGISEYGEASGDAAAESAEHKYYFITSATGMETGIQQKEYGTELISAMEHALGHDRYVTGYHVYGADISSLAEGDAREGYRGDGRITMKELASYFASNEISSTPIFYPDTDETVLLTYSESKGTPAAFLCSIPQENVVADATGQIQVNVTVTNLTNRELALDFGVYTLQGRSLSYTAYTPETVPEGLRPQEDRYKTLGVSSTVGAGSTSTVPVATNWNVFYDKVYDYSVNPFLLKVWDADQNSATYGSYAGLSFYTSRSAGKTDVDGSWLGVRQPQQFTSTTADEEYTVTKVSELLPIEIQYNREPSSLSNVNCTLSLYAYDLGEELPAGLHLDPEDDSVLLDASGQAVALGTASGIFENVQPNPNREGTQTYERRGSTYTYALDASELALQHYYVLQVVSHYRNRTGETQKRVYILIRKTDGAEAGTYQVPRYTVSDIDMSTFANAFGGIPIWKNSWDRQSTKECTVREASEQWEKELDEYFNNKLYTHSVSGWQKWTADDTLADGGSWVDLQDTDHFDESGNYRCRVTIRINYDAVFTKGTEFTFYRHELDGSPQIRADGKEATLTVVHPIAAQSEADRPVLYHVNAQTKAVTALSADDTLYAGDRVIVKTAKSGHVCAIVSGLARTDETITYDGGTYRVYEVKKSSGEESEPVAIAVTEEGSAAAENCGCGSYLYTWTRRGDVAAIRWLHISEEALKGFDAAVGGGIPVGSEWRNGSVTGLKGRVKDNQLAAYLDRIQSGAMSHEVTWSEYDAASQSETPMSDEDFFEEGHQYVSTVTFTILDGFDHIFLQGAEFAVDHHTLLGSPQISEDGRTAVIKILHTLPVSADAGDLITLRLADTGEAIPAQESLKENERITISVEDGYRAFPMLGLVNTGEKTEAGEVIFRVIRGSYRGNAWKSIEIAVNPKAGEEGCGCESILYRHAIAEEEKKDAEEKTGASSEAGTDTGAGTGTATSGTGRKQAIANFVLGEEYVEYYRVQAGGIPVGNGWASGSISELSGEVKSNLLQELLTSITGGRFSYTVTWSRYDAASGAQTLLGDDAVFGKGERYVSTVTIRTAKNYNAAFTEKTVFAFGNHVLLGTPTISADGSTATIQILHAVGEPEEGALKLYRADTGEEITDRMELQPGERVRVQIAEGYRYRILCGLQSTDAYGVYTVEYGRNGKGELGGIEILFYETDTGDGSNCGCGTLLYKHTVGGIGGYGAFTAQTESLEKAAVQNAGLVSLGISDGGISRDGAIGGTGDEGGYLLWLLSGAGSAAGLAAYAGFAARRRRRSRAGRQRE